MDKNIKTTPVMKLYDKKSIGSNKISTKFANVNNKIERSPPSSIEAKILAKRYQIKKDISMKSHSPNHNSQSFALNRVNKLSLNETNAHVTMQDDLSENCKKEIRRIPQISNYMNHRHNKLDISGTKSTQNKSSIADSINMFRNSKINSKIFNFNHSNLKERPKSVSVSYLDNIDNAKITDDKYNSTFIQEQNVFSETERTKLNMLSNLMNDLKSKNKPRIINEMNKIFLCLSNSEDSKTYLKDKIQQVDEKCEVILKENQEIKSFIKAQSKELSILIKEMKCLKLDVNKSCINQSNPSQSKVNLSKNKNLSTATFNSPLKKVEQPIKLLQKKEVNDASLLDTMEIINRCNVEDPKKILYLPKKIVMKKKNLKSNVPKLDLNAVLVDKSESFNEEFCDNNINPDFTMENKLDSNITLDDKMNRAFFGDKEGTLLESNLSYNFLQNKMNESSFKVFDSMSVNNLESNILPDNNILTNIDSNGSTNPNSKKNKLNKQAECFLFGTFDRERINNSNV